MKNKFKKFLALLLLPFVLEISACNAIINKEKEITSDEARSFLEAWEIYTEENAAEFNIDYKYEEKHKYDRIETTEESYGGYVLEGNTYHLYGEYVRESESVKYEIYYYEKDGKYYMNDEKISEDAYNGSIWKFKDMLRIYKLDLRNTLIAEQEKGAEDVYKFYSNGKKHIKFYYETKTESRYVVYINKLEIEISDYKPVYSKKISITEYADGSKEQNTEERSFTYQVKIENPYL